MKLRSWGIVCTRCKGEGWLEPIGPCADGSYVTSRECSTCRGTGKVSAPRKAAPTVPATTDPTTPAATSRQGCDWEAARSDAEMILALLAAKHIGPEGIEAIRDIQNRMDNLARCFQALDEALEQAREGLRSAKRFIDSLSNPERISDTPGTRKAVKASLATIALTTGRK